MSKARKAALDWLPKRKDGRKRFYQCNDDDIRSIYAKGYRKAEKDLELGWEDLKLLLDISHEVFAEVVNGSVDYYQIYPNQQSFLEEVLKRFKAQKGEEV